MHHLGRAECVHQSPGTIQPVDGLDWFNQLSSILVALAITSFAKIVEAGALDEDTVGILLAFSFLLAWLTYEIVEKPLRSATHGRVKVAALALMLVAIGFVGYETFRNDGLGFRTKDRAEFLASFENTGLDWKLFKKLDLTREWRSECSFFNAKKYLEGQLEGGEQLAKCRELFKCAELGKFAVDRGIGRYQFSLCDVHANDYLRFWRAYDGHRERALSSNRQDGSRYFFR
jgi:hypothetical protein